MGVLLLSHIGEEVPILKDVQFEINLRRWALSVRWRFNLWSQLYFEFLVHANVKAMSGENFVNFDRQVFYSSNFILMKHRVRPVGVVQDLFL